MDFVKTDIDSYIGFITLNNSEKGNVLNLHTLELIFNAVNDFMLDDNVRIILLKSNGKNFCLGLDLQKINSTDSTETLTAINLYVKLLKKIISAPKPVMAVIQGDVKAGGVGLACVCDIVIASENATFELSELIFGLIPANVLPFIISMRINPAKARYIALTAKKIDAIEASNINLVDEVFPEIELSKKLKNLIKRMLRISPFAAAELKSFTMEILNKNLDDASELAKTKLFELLNNPEISQTIQAFNNGEMPSWFTKYKPNKPII